MNRRLVVQVVTSLALHADNITLFASTSSQQQGGSSQFQIQIPRLDAHYTGTGDLMTALLLAHIDEEPRNLVSAVEKAVASVQGVLQTTMDSAGASAPPSDKSAAAARSRELHLIQAQHAILQPDIKYRVQDVQHHRAS